MPALHRMPVAYLAVVLAVVVGWLVLGKHGTAQPPASASIEATAETSSSPEKKPSRAPTARPAPEPPEPSDGILRTADGLRRKVLVKDLGLVPTTEAEGGSPVGPTLDYFSIPYLYGASPADVPRSFQIGPRGGPPVGWVPARSVIEWDTRLMARPTPRAGRAPLAIYREQNCLLDALAHRSCSKHAGRCPIEGEEAGDADSAPTAGLPILRSLSIPQPTGPARTVFEVVSLVQDQAPVLPPEQPLASDLPLLKRVYVAFAIDTTASMQSSIDAARNLAESLVAESARQYGDVTLRLGLVEYRDDSPVYGFRTRVVTPFTDPEGFRAALGRIEAAKRGDGTVDEMVLEGVASALPPGGGESLGDTRHLDWPTGRASELATKLLVLLGDAPDHAHDLKRAESLAGRAKSDGITIAAVQIQRSDRSHDEQSRYDAQWRSLAEGSYRPLDQARSYASPIAPVIVSLDQTASLAPRLRSLIDDRVAHARQLAALAAAEAEKRLEEYVNAQGLTMKQVHPVLVDLHRGEAKPTPRRDPQFHGQKAPSVRGGWIAESLDGNRLVTVEMLMSRPELEALIRELLTFQQATQGTVQNLSELLQIGTAAASGETDFLASDRGSLTFADHLRRRQGLPPAPPESLLKRTQADLLQADDLTRSAINERLGTTIQRLVKRRDESDWNDPKQTLDGMALVPYDWIEF